MPDKPKRTPGQLIAVPHTEHPDHKKLSMEIVHIEEGERPTIAETVGIDVGDEIAEANAAHIVSCWNAMDGIGHPEKVKELIEAIRPAIVYIARADGSSATTAMRRRVADALAALEMDAE